MWIARLFKDWMLPSAMAFGICFYLFYHSVPELDGVEPAIDRIIKNLQPALIGVMLFLQFTLISPHDLKPRRWHFPLLAFQLLSYLVFATLASGATTHKLLPETAMLCFICPTAAASGVITKKLGGDLPAIMTYVVLSNVLAAIMIPAFLPWVNPTPGMGFCRAFTLILVRVFSILLLPSAAAWTIRYTFRKLHVFLMRRAHWAFYLWGGTLSLAMMLATKSLVDSKISFVMTVTIASISLLCCLLQFFIGRRSGARYGRAESITAGQALGQKNTGFMIWICYSFLTPVTSIAGGLYALWQNLINSWELHMTESEK